jgi:hypothetical protein
MKITGMRVAAWMVVCEYQFIKRDGIPSMTAPMDAILFILARKFESIIAFYGRNQQSIEEIYSP